MARLPYLEPDQVAPEYRDMLKRNTNLHKLLVNSPDMARAFNGVGNFIRFKSRLDPRLRELAILRVGTLAKASYEWTQHVPIALRVGVTQPQIDALPDWKKAPDRFNDQERAVLAYTDAVAEQIRVPDDIFGAVRAFLSDQQIVELTTTIGYYGMVSRILEALRIELENQ